MWYCSLISLCVVLFSHLCVVHPLILEKQESAEDIAGGASPIIYLSVLPGNVTDHPSPTFFHMSALPSSRVEAALLAHGDFLLPSVLWFIWGQIDIDLISSINLHSMDVNTLLYKSEWPISVVSMVFTATEGLFVLESKTFWMNMVEVTPDTFVL